MRMFYLYKNRCGYYVVNFLDPVTGKRLPGKSTHLKDKLDAAVLASKWLENGVPDAYSGTREFFLLTHSDSHKKSIPVSELAHSNSKIKRVSQKRQVSEKLGVFLTSFWDKSTSQFIREQEAYGRTFSDKHCHEMKLLAQRYWIKYFGDDAAVDEIDQDTLKEFFLHLKIDEGLSGATVNKAMNCGKKAFVYLFSHKVLSENPFFGLENFKANQVERGIPTEAEVKRLLELDWSSDVNRLAFTVAAFCGLRAGEISGLRVCDIDLDLELLHIRHSWSEHEGLKSTKTKKVRDVPIDRSTALELLNMAKLCPNYNESSYVFWSPAKPEQPYWPSYYEDGFYEAMRKIGISEVQRRERNIVFHSLRHFCATLLRQRADLATAQEVLGHSSAAMTKHYSDHESKMKLSNIKKAMQDGRDYILNFSAA